MGTIQIGSVTMSRNMTSVKVFPLLLHRTNTRWRARSAGAPPPRTFAVKNKRARNSSARENNASGGHDAEQRYFVLSTRRLPGRACSPSGGIEHCADQ